MILRVLKIHEIFNAIFLYFQKERKIIKPGRRVITAYARALFTQFYLKTYKFPSMMPLQLVRCSRACQ